MTILGVHDKIICVELRSIAAFAAASRAPRVITIRWQMNALAGSKIWKQEQSHPPDIFVHGNTTGPLLDEELKAGRIAITTRDTVYANKLDQLLPLNEKQFDLMQSLLFAQCRT